MQISHAHTSKIQKIIFPRISVPLISDKYFYSLRHSGSQILTNMGILIGSTRRIYLKLAWKLQAAGMPLHRKLSTWCMGRLMAMPITCRQLFLYLRRCNSSGMGLSASIGLGWKNVISSQSRTWMQLFLLSMQNCIYSLIRYSVPLILFNFILAVNIKT